MKKIGLSRAHKALLCSGVAVGVLVAASQAQAANIDVGSGDWTVSWNNTFKYSDAVRLLSPDSVVAQIPQPGNSNVAQGDLNFKAGNLISNRFDLLSEFNAVYQENTGIRISAAAWYDSAYFNKTANHLPVATNNIFQGPDEFPRGTQNINGKDIELMDALLFHKFSLPGDQSLDVRVGRFAQLYGETLFMGANGIAEAQGPVDVIKAESVPNSTFKEIMMPVGQIAVSYELGHGVLIAGYYQFEYRPDRLPGVGSYFSTANIVGAGNQSLWTPFSLPSTNFSGTFLTHGRDQMPSNQGQFGAEVRIHASDNWEIGFYGANYHEKDPAAAYLTINPTGPQTFADGYNGINIGTYAWAYNKSVQTVGASFATAVGETNVSGEISVRHNQSLDSSDSAGGNGGVAFANAASNSSNNTQYLRGDTFHANVSAIGLMPGNAVWGGAAIIGEVGFNDLLNIINKNSSALVIGPGGPTVDKLSLNPTSTHSAAAFRGTFEPSFFQVLPNVDVTTPIGFGIGLYGRSALGANIGNFNPGGVADLSIGVKATYNEVWHAALNYTDYLGPKAQFTAGGPARYTSYGQDLYDRDFLAFSLTRSF
jgi:hypothetical protein